MTKTFKYLSCLLLGALAVGAWSCSADEYTMPQPNIAPEELVEGVAFSVEHDATNPNIIHLTSLMPPSYQVAWETPQGRKNGATATLAIPFDGEYQVKMGINTRGGYVWSDAYTFTIDDFCAEFVDHYLWKRISGGVGQSKTWQLDLGILDDGSAKTTLWKGPHWFFNTNYTWKHLHAATENENTYNNYVDADPWKKEDAIDPSDVPEDPQGDGVNWYWAADYAGNSWMCNGENYGYLTLDLIGGANFTVTDASGAEIRKGTYMLDTDNYTIAFSDLPLVTSNDGSKSREFKLLYLSETAMQLLSTSSNCATNYVTKDFFDNYVADEKEEEPQLPDGWREDVTQTVITSVKWTLSDKNPLDWFSLGGAPMNNWTSPEQYPDWLGVLDPAAYDGFSMTLDSGDSSAEFSYPDGSSVKCGYTLDNKGIYTFDASVPSLAIIGWASFALDADNGLRILKIEKDAMGNVSGMWLGARDAAKPEYMGWHFIPQAGNGGGSTDALAPWRKALCGKTFAPELGVFCDWLNFDLSGGWTAPSTFGDDYESNGWIWNAAVAEVAKSSSLSFKDNNGTIEATLKYTSADGTEVNESGVVTINPDIPSITLPFDLIKYPAPADWVITNNAKGNFWTTPLAANEWIWVSHSAVGNNLSNIDEKGFWIAGVQQAAADGGKDELLGYWFTLKK